MFLSREINIKLSQIYTKIYIYNNRRFKQNIFSSYATNLKNDVILEEPEKLRFAPIII